jgi:prophage endopeptidase
MMATLVAKAWPFLLAAVIGAGVGVWARDIGANRTLAAERLAHAEDVRRLTEQINAATAAATLAAQKAFADHQAQEQRLAAIDAQLTQEAQAHEADARSYQSALAAGTQRLRVAVARCSTRRDAVPAAASAPGVGDGAPTYADLDPAVASRVFGVATDDQQEIEKVKVLQGYVCAIRPDLPACAH